jgi:hypothetical protein
MEGSHLRYSNGLGATSAKVTNDAKAVDPSRPSYRRPMIAPVSGHRKCHYAKAAVNADHGCASSEEMKTARSVQPAQILLGSKCQEGCRETAERAVAANLAMSKAQV